MALDRCDRGLGDGCIGGLLKTNAISLHFAAVSGTAQIDDVYVDPWVST